MAITTRSRFKGPLFPDVWGVPGRVFFGPLFPDPGPALTTVPPTGPAGAASFALELDQELTVTYAWQTDVFKSYDGQEKRAALLDYPAVKISGSALLIGTNQVRSIRSRLQRSAARGAAFLIGLPYEALMLAIDSVGAILGVNAGALAQCDWANPGQRVIIQGRDGSSVDAVIQTAGGTSIHLDVAPGATGKAGGYILPALAVYLDPKQGFARYRNPEGFERWAISGTAATFGWSIPAVAAQLDAEIAAPPGNSLTGLFLQARTAGTAGNAIRVAIDDESLSGVDLVEVGNDVTISFEPGVSTVGEIAAAINASSTLIKAVGEWNASFVVSSTADEFALTNLAGGLDAAYAQDGTGATVATHAGHPVFDRRLVNETTGDESLQSMAELVDLGGVPESVGQAAQPDWGRFVAVVGQWDGEWQWLKRFLATVGGRWKAFWLPTWRQDLPFVSSATNTITVDNDDLDAWYPTRTNIQIVQTDGTITRATISAAVDNGDGTTTLTIGTTLSGSAVEMVSWLELCRFESDEIAVTFKDADFAMAAVARVVTR